MCRIVQGDDPGLPVLHWRWAAAHLWAVCFMHIDVVTKVEHESGAGMLFDLLQPVAGLGEIRGGVVVGGRR